MNSRYFAVLVSVVVLILLTVPAYAGAQGTSDGAWKMDRYRLLATSDSDTSYHAKGTNSNIYDLEYNFKHFSGPAGEGETNILLATIGGGVTAKDAIAEEPPEGMTREQVAELMANPFSYLWFGMIQNDTYVWDGDLLDFLDEDRKVMNTTMIQPVMSTQWSENWRLIFRPVIPIQSFDTISGFNIITDEEEEIIGGTADFDRKTGLGDIVLWTAFSPQYTPPLVYGFGPTIMMDTASDEWLGTGKWSAGPMGTVCYITDKWIVGGIAQHWWSFAGDSDRDSVNLTDFQPIIRYRLSQTTNIGIAPNIQYNWNADSDDKLRLPLGGGISTVVMLGPLPVGIGAEFYYYVETPDTFGPEYQFRFFFTPVFPSPDWSRVPIFGK